MYEERESGHPAKDDRLKHKNFRPYCIPLPPHLDKLLDSPWSAASSIQVDYWLWYLAAEFEGVSHEQ